VEEASYPPPTSIPINGIANVPYVHQEADEQFAGSAWNNGAPTFPRKYNPRLHIQLNTVE